MRGLQQINVIRGAQHPENKYVWGCLVVYDLSSRHLKFDTDAIDCKGISTKDVRHLMGHVSFTKTMLLFSG